MNKPTVEKIGPTGQRAMAQRNRFAEENQALRGDLREAVALLGLIDAEFRSDPMSVQCFDLSIVTRTRALVAKLGGLL